MLEAYMKSDEYLNMIEKAVDATNEYQSQDEKFEKILSEYCTDPIAYDVVDSAVSLLMMSARELAYKKGFQDAVKLIISTVGGASLWRNP